ncbi:MAG: class I SAM-dependent methyltransferase [Tagaea sp.]
MNPPAEIHADCWARHNIWANAASVRELYAARARDEADEMTCAGQAAELLAPLAAPGESLIDAGCGSGWFFHSLRRRGIGLAYHGFDATEIFVEIGRRELAPFGLPPDRLHCLRIEDFRGAADHVVCMNVLSNIDNFHRPLERLLAAARRTLVLRESVKDGAAYNWVRDDFLDPGVDLRVHVNAYDRAEIRGFVESRGFKLREITDRRTAGHPEYVIGYPHWWTFFVAERIGA